MTGRMVHPEQFADDADRAAYARRVLRGMRYRNPLDPRRYVSTAGLVAAVVVFSLVVLALVGVR